MTLVRIHDIFWKVSFNWTPKKMRPAFFVRTTLPLPMEHFLAGPTAVIEHLVLDDLVSCGNISSEFARTQCKYLLFGSIWWVVLRTAAVISPCAQRS